MKKKFLFILIFLIAFEFSNAENFAIYTGRTSDEVQFLGTSIGGDILHYLQLQLDFFRYIQDDQALYSDNPEENRGDFLGVSLNFALKIPINLIPYLDKFDYIQPYILVGYGYGLESLASEYMDVPDADGKTGIFSKMRQFDSFGYGLIVMVASTIGLKIDFRSIKISEHEGMGYPSRKFNRISFGLCFGGYKEKRKISIK